MTTDTIQNWTTFGVHNAVIEIHKHQNETQTSYNSCIAFFLDDGVNDVNRVISIITEIWDNDPKICALITAKIAEMMYNVSPDVFVLDENGDIVDEFDLDLLQKNSNQTNLTLH